MRLILTPQAQTDLDLIAEPLFSRVIRALNALRDFPEIGAAMTGPFTGYRSLVVDFFRVVYHVRSHEIIVAYVRDCRREPSA